MLTLVSTSGVDNKNPPQKGGISVLKMSYELPARNLTGINTVSQ